jgi:hypothetical protein
MHFHKPNRFNCLGRRRDFVLRLSSKGDQPDAHPG